MFESVVMGWLEEKIEKAIDWFDLDEHGPRGLCPLMLVCMAPSPFLYHACGSGWVMSILCGVVFGVGIGIALYWLILVMLHLIRVCVHDFKNLIICLLVVTNVVTYCTFKRTQPKISAAYSAQRERNDVGVNVYVCISGSSYSYHSDPNCVSLSRCKSEVREVDLGVAESMGRTPCKRCH